MTFHLCVTKGCSNEVNVRGRKCLDCEPNQRRGLLRREEREK